VKIGWILREVETIERLHWIRCDQSVTATHTLSHPCTTQVTKERTDIEWFYSLSNNTCIWIGQTIVLLAKTISMLTCCVNSGRGCWLRQLSSSCTIIASYRHDGRIATVGGAPSTVRAVTEISRTCLWTHHVGQPGRSSPMPIFIADYMSHVSVRDNNHSWQVCAEKLLTHL